MPHRRHDDDGDDLKPEEDEVLVDEEDNEDEDVGFGSRRKMTGSDFINDVAAEDDPSGRHGLLC